MYYNVLTKIQNISPGLMFFQGFFWVVTYHKIPIISSGLIFVQKAFFFAGLIFGGAYFRRGLLLEGILHFKMGWA